MGGGYQLTSCGKAVDKPVDNLKKGCIYDFLSTFGISSNVSCWSGHRRIILPFPDASNGNSISVGAHKSSVRGSHSASHGGNLPFCHAQTGSFCHGNTLNRRSVFDGEQPEETGYNNARLMDMVNPLQAGASAIALLVAETLLYFNYIENFIHKLSTSYPQVIHRAACCGVVANPANGVEICAV